MTGLSRTLRLASTGLGLGLGAGAAIRGTGNVTRGDGAALRGKERGVTETGLSRTLRLVSTGLGAGFSFLFNDDKNTVSSLDSVFL